MVTAATLPRLPSHRHQTVSDASEEPSNSRRPFYDSSVADILLTLSAEVFDPDRIRGLKRGRKNKIKNQHQETSESFGNQNPNTHIDGHRTNPHPAQTYDQIPQRYQQQRRQQAGRGSPSDDVNKRIKINYDAAAQATSAGMEKRGKFDSTTESWSSSNLPQLSPKLFAAGVSNMPVKTEGEAGSFSSLSTASAADAAGLGKPKSAYSSASKQKKQRQRPKVGSGSAGSKRKRQPSSASDKPKPKLKRTGGGTTAYMCDKCGKQLSCKSSLNKHQLIHSGVKPFKCELRSKRFVQSGHLRRHLQTHSGAKPFQCPQCDRQFSDKSTLKEHVKWHTGKDLLQCGVCKKQFRYRSSLRTHQRIHSGVRPYGCSACGRRFFQKTNLLAHIKTHGSRGGPVAVVVEFDTDNTNNKTQ